MLLGQYLHFLVLIFLFTLGKLDLGLLHEMPELARVSDEEYVKETIIPETESLVRNMSDTKPFLSSV
jgi:hypothetical protein